ncbi:MAG: ATP-binding cassette domain-containing protein [Rhodospirillales bacterium]|nr:ATP-binding cassette domain-containing protein [Rhodospirillales bacterium]
MSALAFRDVELALGGRSVLAGVNLAIEAGEFIALLGGNGAGKTTLLRAALGLVAPRRGSISVFGQPAARGNPAIGYMPQSRSIPPSLRLSGRDFVACAVDGARWGLPLPGRAARAEVERVLDLVGAADLARRPLAELSGGERQRLLLAQALLDQPRLLLLDEPLMSLDPSRQAGVVDLVASLQRRLGVTVLFSAHDLNPLLPVMDRVLYVGNRQAALGTVEAVITPAVLSRLYGTPIEVVRAGGHIFVAAGGLDLARDTHGCGESAHGHAHSHRHDGHRHDGHRHDGPTEAADA